MSDDPRPRRRLTAPKGTGEGQGWLLTAAAALVVVIAGWFLGSALARYANAPKHGRSTRTVAVATSTPSPVPSAAASAPSPSPSASPAKTPKAAKSIARPTPSPVSTSTPVAAQTTAPRPAVVAVSAAPAAAPVPMRRTLPVARRFPTRAPAATPASVGEDAVAEGIVRAYIDALRRGDPAAAGTYLGNGAPDESFIDASTRVTNVNTTRNADGSYQIAVSMQTSQGAYNETFVVVNTANGARILGKNATKP